MKLGGFGLMEHYTSMHAAGYDYAELDMPELEALGEEDFARFQDVVAATGLPGADGRAHPAHCGPNLFCRQFPSGQVGALS